MGIRSAWAAAFVGLLAVVVRAQDAGAPTARVQTLDVQPEPATGIDVQVVGEKGKAAKAPLVCVLPAAWTMAQKVKVDALLQTDLLRPNEALAAVAHAFGTAYRASAEGKVRVPVESRRLVACDGTLVGETLLADAPKGPVTVRLLGPRSVLARLRTADGKPAAEVSVQLGTGTWGRGIEAPSDARGECILRLRLGERMQTGMWVEAALPGARQRVDLPSPWPRSPIDLEVAPSGLLRVIAYDAKEQPRADVERVRLQWDGDLFGVEGKAEPSGAMFRVAMGMRYQVEVTFAGTGGVQKVKCAGPLRTGELVVCEVRGVAGPPVMLLRVLGADGKPLAKESIGVVVASAKAVRGFEVTTDADGVLRQLADAEWQEAEEVFLLQRGAEGRLRQPRVALAARTALPATWQPGENRLPDVTLLEEPVVVSGRVVDDAGQPLAKVHVSVRSGWRRPSISYSGSMFQNHVPTDRDGRFSVRDLTAGDEVEVFVSVGKGLEATKATFAKGTTDATLVVHRLGRVRVTLAEVPSDARRLLAAFLVPPGAAPEGDGQELGADSFLSARAGTYDLVLRLNQDTAELARIAGITLQAGADRDEPRLLGLEWRGFAKGIRLTAVTADDRPVADLPVMVTIRRGRTSHGSGGRTGKDGTYFTFVPVGGADISVGGRSDPFASVRFRQVLLENVTEDQRVVLRPKLVAHLKPAMDVALPPAADVQWTATDGDDPLRAFLGAAGFGGARLLPGNVIEVMFDAPGGHSVTMQAFETVDGRRVPHRFHWGTIQVQEAAGVQSFAIELSAEDATRLAELRERLQAK